VTTLTLVRHGETDWNARRLIQGSTDIPLNDTGREQARATAALLRDRLAAEAPLVVAASDLSRARETAEIIADVMGAARPRTYPDLRERGYGEAEGVDVDEFRERWGTSQNAVVPGAEAWAEVRVRALAGLRRAIRDARHATFPVAPSLIVVSHGALIRELIRHATGGEYPAEGERLANGSAHTFLMERDRLSLIEYAGVTG
jgi:probable phosphoglycerate mutase